MFLDVLTAQADFFNSFENFVIFENYMKKKC